LELYPRLALCQRNPLPIQIPPTYSHSSHPTGDHSSQRNRFRQDTCSHTPELIPSSFRLRSLASYPRLALCQRNPLPIQIPPTYRHSSHPKEDHSSLETGSRQNPCSHAPELISSSSRLRSLALYPRLVLCQRNPLPIQIPPTYSHSCHPTGDHSSQRNRFRQDPLPHAPELMPSSFRLRSLASYPRLALCQRNPLPIQIPPTYSQSCHPTGDHSSQETGTRQDPCSHAPELIPSSLRLRSLASYSRLALCQRIPLPIQIPPTYSHSCHPKGDHSSQETGRQYPCPHAPELKPPSLRLRSLASYSRPALCQRNPLPIQIPPTSSHSRHPTQDYSSQETGTRQDPCPHVPELIPSSLRLRSLALCSRPALCQRNALPIQIPPTYNHSLHPKGDHSSQETGSRQDPCPHVPELIPSSFGLRSLASYPRLALCQRIPLPIQIPPSQFKSHHSSQRNRFQTRPMFTCT